MSRTFRCQQHRPFGHWFGKSQMSWVRQEWRKREIGTERRSTNAKLARQRGMPASKVADSTDNGIEAQRAGRMDLFNL